MNYELINYTTDLELGQHECTQIPAVNKMHNGKPTDWICIDYKNNPVTGIVMGNGSLSYFEDGVMHNLHGPADILFDDDVSFTFWYKGQLVEGCQTQEEFDDYIKEIVFE